MGMCVPEQRHERKYMVNYQRPNGRSICFLTQSYFASYLNTRALTTGLG